MNPHPILLNGAWTPATGTAPAFHAFNPATGTPLTDHAFPVCSWDDLEAMLVAGHHAAAALAAVLPDQLAAFLDRFADEIEADTAALAEAAHLETGLPKLPRLSQVELPRTTKQLRLAAAAARDGSWRHATIDTENDIRSVHGPLGGPVIVFGPNNFPFAYNGIAGGDFAAAIASGNPVIAKAHPAHPHTTRLLALAAVRALAGTGLPPATVQLFYQCSHEDGLRLVSHPLTAATGFTGSRRGGLALKQAADQAGKPIYLEMSSVNPVVILQGALRERGEAIAAELHQSCSLGTGQFCTKPGLAFIPDTPEGAEFLARLTAHFAATPPGLLLSPTSAENIASTVQRFLGHGATLLHGGTPVDHPGFSFAPTLLTASAAAYLAAPEALQSEAFGTVCLVIPCPSADVLSRCLATLEGSLTGSIYSALAAEDPGDEPTAALIEPILRRKVGRLLNDKMPTGVAVSPAMNHGGPYPSTGHPGFSAVGVPVSLIRFTALHSYDHVRHHRLPPILRNPNPTGTTWRHLNGTWSQADVS